MAGLGFSFLIAFVASWGLTPLAERLGLAYGFADQPGGRRRHEGIRSRLGGLALYVGLVGTVLLSLPVVERKDPAELARLWGMLAGLSLLFLVGLWDDRRELGSFPQLLAQVLAAGLAIRSGILIKEVANPFGGTIPFSRLAAVALTMLWLVGTVNTVNWLDGLDGLAAGVTAIAALVLALHTFRLGQLSLTILPLALAGSALGFLPFNFHPARVFMGTGGAFTLGFGLAVLSIIGGAKMATALLVLGFPVLDFGWQIAARLRSGRSPFGGDRGHLHYRLEAAGLSPRQVVLFFYGLSALFGTLALVLPSGLYKLYALGMMGLLLVGLLALIGWRTRDRG